jgi:RNA polymerase sigma factor (sigma-70 family)
VEASSPPNRRSPKFRRYLKHLLRSSVILYMDKSAAIAAQMAPLAGPSIVSVINRFGDRLLGFIRRRVRNEADAEDVLQDVWQQLTVAADSGPIEEVGSWLFTVARNKITDRYRKKKPESLEDLLILEDEHGVLNFSNILLDDSNNPEKALLRSLFWKTLDGALDELPEEQRAVFVWNELGNLSFKEMSALTGEKVNTLISRKRYAVLHLRDRLQTLYREITQR